MLRLGSFLRGFATTGAALSSLFAAHLVQYQLLAPDVDERNILLSQTGHTYLPWALRASIVAGVLAAGVAALLGYSYGRHGHRNSRSAFRFGLRTGSMQIGAFLLLETVERMVAEAPFDHLTGRALLMSVLVQATGAALATLALMLVESLAAIVASVPGSKTPRRTRELRVRVPSLLLVRGAFCPGPSSPRAPPQPLSI
jgi:hypothetical protein